MNYHEQVLTPITTAVLLAAGTGSRLYPLTQNAPKCMTIVNGVSILGRLVTCLKQQGFKKLIIVTGHLQDHLKNYLGTESEDLKIEYVFSPKYKTTNNIYSLWMARELINEPFVLLESDLIFDESLLSEMLSPDRMAVSVMEPWMNGTTVTVSPTSNVKAFFDSKAKKTAEKKYKTVNIYSFSLKSWKAILKRLDQHISAGNVNDYYEVVFANMVDDKTLSFDAVSFDSEPWYEIDTLDDLSKAEKLFTLNGYEDVAIKAAI
ncbi:MAG: nucleotidyl transferase [Denitrovibrio sp.]|nr:MAG: nucleotidyl transferase [Denitrovibrio sp.]